jgi:hypothetical protein
MGLLRLLTNQRVLREDVFTPARAWSAFDTFLANTQISSASEPAGLDRQWRTFTAQHHDGSNWWTDAYLAAFAAAGGYTLVTFDAQLASRKHVRTRLLK